MRHVGEVKQFGRSAHDRIPDRIGRLKDSVQSRVEHALGMLNRRFSYVKVRHRGLARNTAQTVFALVNIRIGHRKLPATGRMRTGGAQTREICGCYPGRAAPGPPFHQ